MCQNFGLKPKPSDIQLPAKVSAITVSEARPFIPQENQWFKESWRVNSAECRSAVVVANIWIIDYRIAYSLEQEEKAKIEATVGEDVDDESIGGLGRQIRKLSSLATEEFPEEETSKEAKMEAKLQNSTRIQVWTCSGSGLTTAIIDLIFQMQTGTTVPVANSLTSTGNIHYGTSNALFKSNARLQKPDQVMWEACSLVVRQMNTIPISDFWTNEALKIQK